jgi:hypothetical protein
MQFFWAFLFCAMLGLTFTNMNINKKKIKTDEHSIVREESYQNVSCQWTFREEVNVSI